MADATAERDMARRSSKAREFGAMASTGWPRRLRVPATVIALGGLAAIVVVIFYSLSAYRIEKREEATRIAGTRAAEARQAAELADAPTRAPMLWAKAESARREAEEAVKEKALDRARTLFEEAAKAYREARAEAAKPPREAQKPAPNRLAAEHEQKRTTDARDAAKQAGADYYAGKLFISAQGKERDANTAFGRSDYSLAIQLFGEAQSEYQAAVREADDKRKAERREKSGVLRR